jgi:hypothetical protein
VTRPPDFDELVDEVGTPAERERLRRVHELLVASGPPPDLSPTLAAAPDAAAVEDEEPDVSWLPRRRLGAGAVLAFGLAAAAFGAGWLFGNNTSDEPSASPPTAPARVVSLRGSDDGTSGAIIRLGRRDAGGNWPMVVTVRGLEHLTQGDYYTLALAEKGKPVVTCGTFNTSGKGATTVRMVAAYDLDSFDGWVITRYDAESHRDTVVMEEI